MENFSTVFSSSCACKGTLNAKARIASDSGFRGAGGGCVGRCAPFASTPPSQSSFSIGSLSWGVADRTRVLVLSDTKKDQLGSSWSFLEIMCKFDRISSLHPGGQTTIGVCYSSIQELIVPITKSEDRIHSLVPLRKCMSTPFKLEVVPHPLRWSILQI